MIAFTTRIVPVDLPTPTTPTDTLVKRAAGLAAGKGLAISPNGMSPTVLRSRLYRAGQRVLGRGETLHISLKGNRMVCWVEKS